MSRTETGTGTNRWLWSAAVALLCVGYYALVERLHLWQFIGAPPMDPLFADLHGVLSASDCARKGFDVYRENPCDVAGRVHLYGRPWLWLSHLGITNALLTPLGLLLDAAVVTAMLATLKPATARQAALAAAILLSSAVALAMNRANVDHLLFLLVWLAAALFARGGAWAASLAGAAVYVATALKFYPAVAIAGLLFAVRRAMPLLAGLAVFAAATAAYGVWARGDLAVIFASPPAIGFAHSFGAGLLFMALGIDGYQGWGHAAFLVATGIAVLVARRLEPTDPTDQRSRTDFAVGAAVILALFALSPSFQYKLLYIVLCLPFLVRRASGGGLDRRLARVAVALVVVKCWFSFFRGAALFLPHILLHWGDEAAVAKASALIFALDHLLFWGLATLLMAFATRLAADRAAELGIAVPLLTKGVRA